MKKAVLLILISLMTSVLSAQEADTHIASLVNNEEWFALAESLSLTASGISMSLTTMTAMWATTLPLVAV